MSEGEELEELDRQAPTTPAAEDLPAEVVAAAAAAKVDQDDPIVAVFIELARAREGIIAASHEDRQALHAECQALQESIQHTLEQQRTVLDAQAKLLREKADAARKIIQAATKQAASAASRTVRRQGTRTLTAVDAELQKRLRDALREAAALDQRTWADKYLPPALSGLTAGMALFLMVALGWNMYASRQIKDADSFRRITESYLSLPREEQQYIKSVLFMRRTKNGETR